MNKLKMSNIVLSSISLPRHREIPNVGLYLKQVVIYINEITEPLLHTSITPTMLSNYVKMHLVTNPTKKMYNRDQVATLLFIVLVKNVLSLDHIRKILDLSMQQDEFSKTYDYFCEHLEKMLQQLSDTEENVILFHREESLTVEHILENVIAAFVQRLYVEECFLCLTD